MKILILGFFISLPKTLKADILSDIFNYQKISTEEDRIHEDESNYTEIPDSSEAEVYHWELGTPDNIPETVIIYTQNDHCGCYK